MPITAKPAPRTDNVRGGAWMLFAVVNASAMTVAVRALSGGMDSGAVVLWRSAVTLALIAPLFAWPAFRRAMRFSRPWAHLLRGLMIAFSTHLGFYTISQIPLATTSVLFFTAPIFATMLAGPVNGERVGPRRWAAVLVGFIGALIILRPGVGDVHPAMLAALGSSLLFAASLAMSRGLAEADGPLSTYVSSVALTVVVSLPLGLHGLEAPVGPVGWAALAVLVVSGVARGVGDIQAYRHGEASVMGVIAYLRLLLIGAAGYLMFDETVDRQTLIGGAVIVAATLYIAHREATLRQARPGPKAGPAD